jgi:O-antigen/teichoic acid export membrane protein
LLYGGSSLVCQFLRTIGLLISTRLVPADQFGIFATAVMILGLSGLIKEIGQNSAFLSCRETEREYTNFHFSLACIGVPLTAAFLLLLIFAIPSLSILRSMTVPLLLTIACETLLQTPQIIATKRFEFGRIAAIEISAVASWTVATIIASFVLRNALALVLGRLAEVGVRGALLLVWYRRDLSLFPISRKAMRYYLRFARLLGPLGWMEYFTSSLDVILLKLFVTDSELGIYDRTQQLLRVPLSLSINLVDRVAGSSYSREQALEKQTRRSMLQFIAIITAGIVVGLILIELFIGFLAKPILGADWQSAVGSLWPWAIPFCILRPHVSNFNILFQGSGRPAHLFASFTATTLGTLVFGLIFIPALHARGAYLALGLTYGIVFVFVLRWFLARFVKKRETSSDLHSDQSQAWTTRNQ